MRLRVTSHAPRGVQPHSLFKRAVHDRQGDLENIYLTIAPEVEGRERIAHPISEPGAVGISEGSVVLESGLTEVLPRLWNLEP